MREISLVKITAVQKADVFYEHLIIPYGILKFLYTDSGPQFDSKFFCVICKLLKIKLTKTTVYHIHSIGQVEHFEEIIV